LYIWNWRNQKKINERSIFNIGLKNGEFTADKIIGSEYTEKTGELFLS